MGLAEVLPRLPNLLRRIRETGDAAAAMAPDALVTIDSPDFSLRVAKRARRLRPDLRVIHYVAPSVWAWRPGRAAKMARGRRPRAGAPAVRAALHAGRRHDLRLRRPSGRRRAAGDARGDRRASAPSSASRRTSGCSSLLPGSRRGEVTRLGPVFAEVARRLRAADPALAVVAARRRPGRRPARRAAAARRRGLAALLDPRGFAEGRGRRRASARPSPPPTWRSPPPAPSASSSPRPARRW